MEENSLRIYNDEQLKSFLYLKDELIQFYEEMRLVKNIDYKVVNKIKTRLDLISDSIDNYIRESENIFPIVCLEQQVIEPEEKRELKTSVIGLHINDAEVIFDGSIPSAGPLKLSYEDKSWGTNVLVENNISKEVLEKWDICGYHYNDPMTIKYFDPGVFRIEKNTVVGIGMSKQKELVKKVKKNNMDALLK